MSFACECASICLVALSSHIMVHSGISAYRSPRFAPHTQRLAPSSVFDLSISCGSVMCMCIVVVLVLAQFLVIFLVNIAPRIVQQLRL